MTVSTGGKPVQFTGSGCPEDVPVQTTVHMLLLLLLLPVICTSQPFRTMPTLLCKCQSAFPILCKICSRPFFSAGEGGAFLSTIGGPDKSDLKRASLVLRTVSVTENVIGAAPLRTVVVT